jgi:8-oxo-dGTP pyrophosphatase MutT (NUDIX family)
MTTPSHRQKALAYITHAERLLVFRQSAFPEEGLQVPGGGIDAGESPESAVLREAFEETGLVKLRIESFLGTYIADLSKTKGRIEDVHTFHLIADGDLAESWKHVEMFDSDLKGPVEMELFWWKLEEGLPTLHAFQGTLLGKLVRSMRIGFKDTV